MSIEFFHECIGRYLGEGLDPQASSVAMLNHRALKGVKKLRLGQIDVFYIAKAGESKLIGRIEEANTSELEYVGTETTSARKYLATWILHKAATPFMIGVIGNANPNSSFEVTQTLSRCTFCEPGKSFRFDVEKLRKAFELVKDYDWKKVVSIGIHAIEAYRNSTDENREKAKLKLEKIFEKSPDAKNSILAADIRPNSGEYTILSWYNIEEKVSATI